MRERVLIIALIILLLSAGVVLAYPTGPNGEAYPVPATATIEPYPVVWPTATVAPTATDTPQPQPAPKPSKPTKTPPPQPPTPTSVKPLQYIPTRTPVP